MIPEPIFKIEGAVQHYDWGGHHFIPSLMGIANERQQPFAESWYGGHSMHPSLLVDKQGRKWPLSELIKNNPVAYLGDSTEKQFPFLLKLLDVKNMLSIQAHPNKTQAQKGFSKENELHIPFNASNRNYKDANHKPEMMVALSDFWLLHGFKNESDLMATLRSHTELDEFVQHFQAGGYQQLLHYLMNLPMVAVEDILKPILPRLPRVDKNHYGYWMNKYVDEHPDGPLDRGLLCFFILNLVHLHPYEGIYQPAGMLHSYLFGQNIELMANSDNVLRGGLTNKHIDVEELLHTVLYQPTLPQIINRAAAGASTKTISEELLFQTPAIEFELTMLSNAHNAHPSPWQHRPKPQILIVLQGEFTIETDCVTSLHAGEAVFIRPNTAYGYTLSNNGIAFRASVP